ncbi:hypothetical protein IMSAGC012_00013 [Lachnospiraceae bacterium]|nr:hypothetical protein IMSAGC012_00013 [Lachnospiraceae bacterium]
MAKRKISLKQWCKENNREDLLREWNEEKNSTARFPMSPSTMEFSTALNVWWKCKNGHEWQAPIQKRTTFGLECPICNPDEMFIPIGTKYGCLTVIGVTPVDESDQFGKIYGPSYKCICDCGKEVSKSEFAFLEKKHRYCTETIRRSRKDRWLYEEYDKKNQCGLKTTQEEKKKETYKRVLAPGYSIDYTGTIHESLEVLECVNNHYEEIHSISDARKKGGGTYYVYKLYRCRCYLCGKEQQIKSSKFSINPPTEYGYTAYNGYWSDAYCNCHPISSFQWIVTKLLKENRVPYRVEVSFPDLYGVRQVNLLRYDFGIYDEDGKLQCLIECQGEQHYEPVEEFGGDLQFLLQQKNDDLKRKYAKEKGILLYEIPYKNKKYEKVERFLQERGVIN